MHFELVREAIGQQCISDERDQAVGGVEPTQPDCPPLKPDRRWIAPREPFVPEEVVQYHALNRDWRRHNRWKTDPFDKEIQEDQLECGTHQSNQVESAEPRASPPEFAHG